MALIGFADLRETALPTLWDAGEITKVRLADGSSFGEMLGDAARALGLLNAEVLSMPGYSQLYAVQDEPQIEYGVGVANSFEEATEYTAPDPTRGKTTGHMLPITPYDLALGWTMMYLRNARRNKLDQDVRQMIVAGRKLYQQRFLSRFFSSTANTVAATSGADVPFADGGSADATYVPPESPSGEVFLYTHSHFLGYSTTGISQNTFDNSALSVAVEHLQEHGYDQPYVAICSRTDIGSWAAVDGFKAPTWANINYQQSAVERAQFGDIRNYFGAVETDYGMVLLWETPRLPTKNFGVFPTGISEEERPLRMRINPNFGFGINLVPGNWINAPALMLVAFTEFGIGVGNRVGGVCVDLEASSWAAPTIS
jgi:hypothetical protein